MAKITYDLALAELKAKKKSTKRSRLTKILRAMKFEVESNGTPNHYSYANPHFVLFPVGTFDGTHEKDGNIKLPYILDVIRIFEKYEDEIRDCLGEKK